MVGNGFTHFCILETNPFALKFFWQDLVDGFYLCLKDQVFFYSPWILSDYSKLVTFDRGSFNSHCAFQALPPAAPSYAATSGAAAAADREPGNKNSWCWKIPFEEKFGVLKIFESWQIIVVEKSRCWQILGFEKLQVLKNLACWIIQAVEKLKLLKNSFCWTILGV